MYKVKRIYNFNIRCKLKLYIQINVLKEKIQSLFILNQILYLIK